MSKTTTHYISALLRHARRLNLDVEQVMSDIGISWEQSQVEQQWIDNSYVAALVKRLWQETGNETMGFDPVSMRIGSWAVACEFMLAAETLGDLLRRGERILSYLPPTSMAVTLEIEQDSASIIVGSYVGDNDPDHFLVEFMSVVWHRFPSWTIDENIRLQRAFFSYPEPPHSQFYEELFQCDVAFDQPSNGFSFNKKYLNKRICRTQTELNTWLRDSPADLMYMPGRETSVQSQIKIQLLHELNECMRFPAFETVCSNLAMSAQVVRRRLSEEGTSYQQIKDSVRRDLALELLSNPEIPISQIAERTGFTEPAAFSRAFKKWSGMSPAQFRTDRSSDG